MSKREFINFVKYMNKNMALSPHLLQDDIFKHQIKELIEDWNKKERNTKRIFDNSSNIYSVLSAVILKWLEDKEDSKERQVIGETFKLFSNYFNNLLRQREIYPNFQFVKP